MRHLAQAARTLLLSVAVSLAGPSLAQDTAEPPPAPPPKAEPTPSLEEAYQKEFAYLAAEKEQLTERLAAIQEQGETEIGQARAELDSLQGKLVRLQTGAEQTELLLQDVERAATAALEADDMVNSTVFQASNSLQRDDYEPPEAEDASMLARATVLRALFAKGIERIDEGRAIRQGGGEFITLDGKKVAGKIVQIGGIASYGIAPDARGALKPIGGGRLQLWREPAEDSATVLADGGRPDTLDLFLYESADKGITEAPEKTWAGYVDSAGVVGVAIMLLGVLAMVLVVLRAVLLALLPGAGDAFVHEVVGQLRGGDVQGALATAKGRRGAIPRVVATLVEGWGRDREAMEDVASEALLREQPRVDRFSTAILVIAAVAPLMGLLGTVTGMIATFDIITEFGTGDPRRLSGGISEALVTTQLGLVVAIPSLLLGNLLSNWGTSVMGGIERAALMVLNADGGPAPAPEPATAPPSNPEPARA